MSKGNSVLGVVAAWLRQTSDAGQAGLRRVGAPLALGLFASLSTVGHAGLPAKAVPRAAAAPAAAAQIKPLAATQIAAIEQIKKTASASQRKLDSRLLLSLMKQRGDARLSGLNRYRYAKPGDDGRFAVDISLARGADPKAVLEALGRLDAPLLSPKKLAWSARSIRSRVALKDLEALAAMKAISRIRQAVPAHTSASRKPATRAASRIGRPLANALNRSEGVLAHGADEARTTYGASGQGQMICVLSDGIDALAASQASGDLPAGITVLPGQAGSGDEGTAMLEIVHDMAPGAAVGFATDLRSGTQGKGNFTMEFAKYAPLPSAEQQEMMAVMEQTQNVVVLTGDYHESLATEVPSRPGDYVLDGNSVAVEFICPSVTSPGLSETLEGLGIGPLADERHFRLAGPHGPVGHPERDVDVLLDEHHRAPLLGGDAANRLEQGLDLRQGPVGARLGGGDHADGGVHGGLREARAQV